MKITFKNRKSLAKFSILTFLIVFSILFLSQFIFRVHASPDPEPSYSLNSTNSTIAGTPILHSLNWTDESGLSGYTFQFCNGTWNGSDCLGGGEELGTPVQINDSTQATALTSFRRSICRDGQGNLHATWKREGTWLYYANSSDDGATWSVKNISTGSLPTYAPAITCTGNNIYILYVEGDTGIVKKSSDNGNSFTKIVDIDLYYFFRGVIEARGNRVYIIWENLTAGDTHILFQNSTDGGSTWGNKITIMSPNSGYDVTHPSFIVDGIGDSSDKIYVVAKNTEDENIYFVNSTDSGVTWGSKISIMSQIPNLDFPSITYSGTNLYVAAQNGTYIYFTNSTDSGIIWTTDYRIDTVTSPNKATSPSVTINKDDYPIVFWEQNETNANWDIVYRNYDGNNWETVTYVTNDNLGHTSVVTKYDFSNNRIEFIYKNGTASLWDIIYNYLEIGEGGWSNDTWASFSGTWSNVTKTVNSTVGAEIAWCVYANNSLDQWNGTSCDDPFSYITTSSDSTPPLVTIQSPSNITYPNNTIWFNVTLDEAGDKCLVEISGTNHSLTNSTGNWNYLNNTLDDGSYITPFYCNDTAGNMNGTESISFTIDTTPPSYSLNSTNSTIAGTPILHSLNWTDESGLSGYTFQFCNGTWNGSDCLGGDTLGTPTEAGITQEQIAVLANYRDICRDGQGNIHMVWQYKDQKTVTYANSSDDGATWSVKNITDTDYIGIKKPSLSCDGNNIYISHTNDTGMEIYFFNSSDNGATFTKNVALPSSESIGIYKMCPIQVNGSIAYMSYVFQWDAVSSIGFINSSDGGITWSSPKTVMNITDGSGCEQFGHLAMVVDWGSAPDGKDRIHLSADCYTLPYRELYYSNSTDSGENFGTPIIIIHAGLGHASITYSGSNVYAVTQNESDYSIWFANSTDYGATWTPEYQIDPDISGVAYSEPVLSLTNENYPIVLFEHNTSHTNKDIGYIKYNGTAWESMQNITDNDYGNKLPNAKYKFDNNKVEFFWINGTASPFNVLYNYIEMGGTGWSNDTWASFSGTWSNVTKTIIDQVGAEIAWCVYANDTSNNWNSTSCQNPFSYTTTEVAPPSYSLNSTNSTIAGTDVEHSLYWQDDSDLSHAIFSFDNCTGSLQNISTMSLSGSATWSNFTVRINSTEECTIRWCVYANDTSNNWNGTSCVNPFSYVTTSPTANYPTYSDNSTNSTIAGIAIEHRLKWQDAEGLSGYIFSFCNGTWDGSNCPSTEEELYLHIADIDLLDDTMAAEWTPDTTYGAIEDLHINDSVDGRASRVYLKFNLSLPSGITKDDIIEAELTVRKAALGYHEGMNWTFHHVYNQTWTEEVLTWNNQPCGTGFDDSSQCNLTFFASIYDFGTQNKIIDATDPVKKAVENGYNNISFIVKSPELGEAAENETNVMSKEYEPVEDEYGAKLNITYATTGWQNNTWVVWSGSPTEDWSNVTKTVNSTVGATIAWCTYANDTSNNWNSTSCQNPFSYTTTSDTVPPTYSNNQTQLVTAYTSTGYSNFSITWNDNLGSINAYLENNFSVTLQNSSMSGSYPNYYYNSTPLKAGTYQFRFVANDSFGNSNATSIQYFIISKAPTSTNTLLNGTDGDKSYNQYQIANFTVHVNISGKTVKLNSNMTGFSQQSGTTPLYNYTNLTQAGTFYINGSFNGDENYTASFEVHYFSVNDTTAPTISNVQSGSITSSTAIITWSTNENSNSSLVITPSATYSNSSSMVTSHSITLTGMSEETTYYYNVTSCDASGNCANSTGHQFTTTSAPSDGGGGGGGECTEDWSCTVWSQCYPNSTQYRNCTDKNRCGTTKNKPAIVQNCTYSIIPPLFPVINITNITYPEFPFNLPNGTQVYYPTRFAAIVSSLLAGNFQGVWLNIVYSMTDYYYRPKLNYGPLNIMFMHITIFIGLYLVLGLFIRWIKLFKRFSATFKALIYFIILPLICLTISLFLPTIV